MSKNKQVVLKASGEKAAVINALEKIKPLFPLSVQSPIKKNDADDGVHVFLTVAEEAA